ncbi:protein FAR1-RELATED SEQUENCE 7-like isoform X2 [Coffea eugenioides]|uniref:protein FAR1-RELATED SEQUENCE 7-like isoform X2 n=1 Tax=Coffea eugenioides TaxID=49369 RepID=UPI000F60D867|nr:protein FAR1-RELATED SEQUENCE 7-like isoform X2 [Coffea eugenioides]
MGGRPFIHEMGDKEDQLDMTQKGFIPYYGQLFDSDDEAYKFYNMYAATIGFGVRKEYCNKDKLGMVTSRKFACNKEGFRRQDKRDRETKRPRTETKTGCLACVIILLDRDTKMYKVTQFVAEHNHPLHIPQCVHMIPSQRRTTITQDNSELVDAYGLSLKQSNNLVDKLGYLPNKRSRGLRFGEAGTIFRYFQQQLLENPSFYFAVQLDSEEQLTNVFWADARMTIDYKYFGEVVTFDTTFRTNEEYRPLGIFLGFNHHRQMVIFGAALLYDDSVDSYKWLFQTFLEAMSGKPPRTFFTDQEPAMAKASASVMPNTFHGLCTHHIRQNFLKHLGHMMRTETGLVQLFSKCMLEIEDEVAFEETWREMLQKHNLDSNTWLKSIYELREKWAKTYMKTKLTLGMRSKQLSKSFNADLKHHLKTDQDLVEFFTEFHRAVEKRRYKELTAEYGARQKVPSLKIKYSPMLNQVAEIYTPTIFEEFQDEFDVSLALVVKGHTVNDNVHEYMLARFDGGDDQRVICEKSTQSVLCSCQKYECEGILCSHAIKVLDLLNIKLVPNDLIEKRWTRDAKKGILKGPNQENDMEEDVHLKVVGRYRMLCSTLVRVAIRAAECQEATDYLVQCVDKLTRKVEEICNKQMSIEQASTNHQSSYNATDQEDVLVISMDVNPSGSKSGQGCKSNKRTGSWTDMFGEKSMYESNNNQVQIADQSQEVSVDHVSSPQSANNSVSARSCSQSTSDPLHLHQATTCPSQDSNSNSLFGQSSVEVVQRANNGAVLENRNFLMNFNGLGTAMSPTGTQFLMVKQSIFYYHHMYLQSLYLCD